MTIIHRITLNKIVKEASDSRRHQTSTGAELYVDDELMMMKNSKLNDS